MQSSNYESYIFEKEGETIMGLFFKKKKKEKEIILETVPSQDGFSLENQNGKTNNISSTDIEDYLNEMFGSFDQFVILTSPKTQNHVRFIQACMVDNQVEVQILIENPKASLYYKQCSKEECLRIFLDYYHNTFIPNMNEYQPVQLR